MPIPNVRDLVTRRDTGFTLIELLVVVVIIGILIAIALSINVIQWRAIRSAAMFFAVVTFAGTQLQQITRDRRGVSVTFLHDGKKIVRRAAHCTPGDT